MIRYIARSKENIALGAIMSRFEYLKLADAVAAEIASGALKAGDRLPPQRHLLLGFLDAGQNPPRLRQERLAFLGQLEAPRGAAQQRHRQLVLQPTQRPADARGGLFQLLGRSADPLGRGLGLRGKRVQPLDGGGGIGLSSRA